MSRLRDRLRRLPLPLLFALIVVIGASVVMIVQVILLPPPPAIVAPIEMPSGVMTNGSQTYVITIQAISGMVVQYNTLAAMGRVSLFTNTSGWSYMTNDWVLTVVRRTTGNATFSAFGDTVDVFQYNATHALVVTQSNRAVVTKIIPVGSTGWYVYHPVVTSYDPVTLNAIINYMKLKGQSSLMVFQPKTSYIYYGGGYFKVYFDVVSSSGTVTPMGGYMQAASGGLTVLQANTATIPSNTITLVDASDVVLAPVWAVFVYKATANLTSMLQITPQPPQ